MYYYYFFPSILSIDFCLSHRKFTHEIEPFELISHRLWMTWDDRTSCLLISIWIYRHRFVSILFVTFAFRLFVSVRLGLGETTEYNSIKICCVCVCVLIFAFASFVNYCYCRKSDANERDCEWMQRQWTKRGDWILHHQMRNCKE